MSGTVVERPTAPTTERHTYYWKTAPEGSLYRRLPIVQLVDQGENEISVRPWEGFRTGFPGETIPPVRTPPVSSQYRLRGLLSPFPSVVLSVLGLIFFLLG